MAVEFLRFATLSTPLFLFRLAFECRDVTYRNKNAIGLKERIVFWIINWIMKISYHSCNEMLTIEDRISTHLPNITCICRFLPLAWLEIRRYFHSSHFVNITNIVLFSKVSEINSTGGMLKKLCKFPLLVNAHRNVSPYFDQHCRPL